MFGVEFYLGIGLGLLVSSSLLALRSSERFKKILEKLSLS